MRTIFFLLHELKFMCPQGLHIARQRGWCRQGVALLAGFVITFHHYIYLLDH